MFYPNMVKKQALQLSHMVIRESTAGLQELFLHHRHVYMGQKYLSGTNIKPLHGMALNTPKIHIEYIHT